MSDRFKIRFFITGIYRSGTTLVSRILNNHPKIWVTYDSVHFMRFSYGRYNPVQNLKNAVALIDETYNRIHKRWNMEFNRNNVLTKIKLLRFFDYKDIYNFIMTDMALKYKKGAIGWAEKTNVCWSQIPNFLKMFPIGKAIHVIRDPRDVLCSYKHMTYEPGYSYLDSAFCSLDSFLKADEYLETFSKDNYYLLKYEDLLRDPRAVTKNLCSFLGIKFKQDLLDVARFRDKSNKWWTGESSFEKQMRTISTRPIGRWKKNSTPLEIFFVELINRDAIRRHGYELSSINIKKTDWNKLYEIVCSNKLLKERYLYWLKTAEGVEAYPSDPLKR